MIYCPESYIALLEHIRSQGYRFAAGYHDWDSASDEPQVILRHDIDVSLGLAVRMAMLDRELGIPSIFFAMLRSPHYNIYATQTRAALEMIVGSGEHRLGLHYTPPDKLPADLAEVESWVQADWEELYKALLPIPVTPEVSWHRPTLSLLRHYCERKFLGRAFLWNAYSQPYFLDAKFLSDSNCRYTDDELRKFFDPTANPRVQLLIHPLIWMAGGDNMLQVWANVWPHLIREQEVELRESRIYGAAFPCGIPDSIRDSFAQQVKREATKRWEAYSGRRSLD